MQKWWWSKERTSEEKLRRIVISDTYQNLDIEKDVPMPGVFRSFSEYSSPEVIADPYLKTSDLGDFQLFGMKKESTTSNPLIKKMHTLPVKDSGVLGSDTHLTENLMLSRLEGDSASRLVSKETASRPISTDSVSMVMPSVVAVALPEPQLLSDANATIGKGEQLEEMAEVDELSEGEESVDRMGRKTWSATDTLKASSGGAGFDWSLVGTPNGDAAGVQATVTTMDSTATLISNSSKGKSKFQFYFWWTLNTDAYLVAISLALGLGNLLRLPRMAVLNGGGVFMIVYICITLLLGIPLIFLEIGLGQFCQQGTVKLWQAVPLFKGVGFVKVFASLLMSIYYPMLMTISMFYFIWSAKDSVPISVCESSSPITTFIEPGGGFGNKCLNDTILHPTQSDGTLFAVYIAFIFLIWSLFCLCLCKSVSSYRLSIYILILPTIACIIAELVNATTIGNDNRGIDMLTTLDWQQLKEPRLWYFATIQMFFSTHAGMGNIVTCAGKMYSKTNAFWIAVSYVFLNLITGIMFVVTVYLWIGQTYISISDIKPEIPEMFVINLIYDTSYHHPNSMNATWTSLAFLTLIFAGFISMVALLFSAILSLVQESERKIKWWHIVMAMSGIGFSLGVLFVLQPNLGILHMLDHYVIGRMVIATTILELIGFGWIYGGDTLYKDFEFVLGQKLNVMWKYLWIIIPVLLLALEIMSLIKLPLDGFENKEDYPWIYGIGWSIYLTTWFIVISIAIRQISNQVDYNFTDRFLSSLKPSIDWGPVDPICRHRWKQWGDQYSLTGRRDFTLSRRGTRDYTHSVRANSCPFQFYFWWTLNTDAYLVAISLALGLGNLLRLPRMAVLNGGGVFMIVYICITLLLGIPLIFLEIGLGQFCQQGTVKLWQAVPLFKGVGFVKVFASLLMSIYYPMLMTISMFYFIWSAKDSVPISVCESSSPITTFIEPGGGFGNKCLNDTILHPTQSDGTLFAVYIAFIFLIWSLFCLCLCKSVSSYRLSIYILILPTIACIIAELVNATTIGNDNRGIDMLTTLDWQQLKEPRLWYFATIQMFFSTHAGMGNIVTCAGKMYSKTNAFWIAVSYVFLNLITGIMFVVTVYLWIGQTYISISDIKPEIPEMFVINLIYDTSYHHPNSMNATWTSLAFLTLIFAGFISMVALLFSAILSLVQESERKIKWWHIVMAMSGIGFSLGVLFVLQPNLGILHMLDHYVIGRMVIATTILELIGFGWIYGGDTLYKDFEFVLGQKLNVMWKYLWIIIPVLLLALEIMSLIKLPLDGFENKEDYPWIYGIGWSIYLTTWFIVISIAIRQISNQVDYNFTDRFLSSLKPSIDWGPVDPICRHRWKQWGDQYSLTGRRDFTLSRRGTRDYTHSVRANSCPVIITQSILPPPHLASSSENDTDNNSNEPFTLTARNGSLNHSSNGPFTLQSNGAIGGRKMPKGRYWRPIH